ncbi:MAG: metallophosphatase domain-containing protein [Bacteroidota bacterium]
MRIVFISDTHNRHADLELPAGDLLVHAGDFSSRGREWEVREFMAWFSQQSHARKVVVAGNHDFLAENDPAAFAALVPAGVDYLNDSGVEIGGLQIWGSPVQPEFYDWAFNRKRGPEIARHWALIPEGTDLLVTHGPPYGALDKTTRGEPVGCKDLRKLVEAIRPRIHVFGHIHEAYGTYTEAGVHYINASSLDERYLLRHAPVVVDI